MRLLQWHKAGVVERGGAGAADVGGEAVECEALGAGDSRPVRHSPKPACVLRRREQQQVAVGAGVEGSARWLVLWREAVGFERNERKPFFHRGAGDLLLSRTDAGRDKYSTARGGVEEAGLLGGEGFGRNTARALDLKSVGTVEQEGVAVGGIGCSGEWQGVDAREVVGVGETYCQPAGIVADVSEECFKLAFVGEDAVVVTGGEEGGAAMYGGAPNRSALAWGDTRSHPFGCGRQSRRLIRAILECKPVWWRAIHGAISLGTAHFKSPHHLAQMTGHAAAHEEKAMEMVGHDGGFEQLYFGMNMRDLPPAVGDDFAERREGDPFADKTAEDWPTALGFKGNHVNATLVVIVAEAPTLHGRLHSVFHTAGIISDSGNILKEAA